MGLAIRGIAPGFGPVHAHPWCHELLAEYGLANGSTSTNQSIAGDIRRAHIEADLVDCMVALLGQHFYGTQIPVCLRSLAKNKAADAKRGFRDRRKQTLFIDARKLGTLDCKTRPRRRSSKTIGAYRGQKTCASQQTKGFSRFRASETARRPEFV